MTATFQTTLGALLAPWLSLGPELAELVIGDLRLDHRELRPGGAFVALNGTQRHGLHYAEAAAAQGAVVVLFDPEGAASVPALSIPAIAVPGLREQLGALAARFFGEPAQALRVIGVTGTNGKTSTVQLIAQALTLGGVPCATLGTLGAGVWPELRAGARTTPDAIGIQRFFAEVRAAGVAHVAMEVSSHALDQGRVNGVPFAVAVYTNLTRDHLDYHGTMEAYAAAKARLFTWPGLQHAVLNMDDAVGAEWMHSLPISAQLWACTQTDAQLRLGAPPCTRVAASAVHAHGDGLEFQLELDANTGLSLRSALVGRFNVANLLGVIAALRALDVPASALPDLVAQLQPVPGRMNRVSHTGAPLVVVDYAHTPDALEQALRAVREHSTARLGCVFGCGGDRDRGKRPQMGALAAQLADWSILTDDNPRSEDGSQIVADILAGMAGAEVRVERDRRRAIHMAVNQLQPGDALLIAGKGHETYQEIGGICLPFNDAEVTQALLLERAA